MMLTLNNVLASTLLDYYILKQNYGIAKRFEITETMLIGVFFYV